MKDILKTRLIHWKKQWISLLFWMLFPIISTLLFIYATGWIQEDSKVPVGIVLEEETTHAKQLLEQIEKTALLRVVKLTEEEARNQVENHSLDSAFVIQEGYDESLKNGNRNWLIKSYSTDLSFAYTPVKEMIISYVQEETGRSKTAYIVQELSKDANNSWTWEEITAKALDIQKEENLLYASFSFSNQVESEQNTHIILWNTWGIWAIFSLLSTLLLFDWMIKERKPLIQPRYAFMRFSFKSYLTRNLMLYFIVFFIMDLIAIGLFHFVLNEIVTIQLIGFLILYRLMIHLAAFFISMMFSNTFAYYGTSFILVVFITILSGAILPVDGLSHIFPWFDMLNPLHSFLNQEWINPWLVLLVILFLLWRRKGVGGNASS